MDEMGECRRFKRCIFADRLLQLENEQLQGVAAIYLQADQDYISPGVTTCD